MALVKTSKIVSGANKAKEQSTTDGAAPSPKAPVIQNRGQAPKGSLHEKASERIAAATEELASGLMEAASAAEELRRSMEQIATGAEEAAGASQEQLAAIKSMVANLNLARNEADTCQNRTNKIQIILSDAGLQITASVRAIEKNAGRQQASVQVIAELERRAQDISAITQTVSRISDQTNLLALNAAIEAARAGDHGRGFAVVADEVRALAETSEKSAVGVQSLSEAIQNEVRSIVRAVTGAAEIAVKEAKAGGLVVDRLESIRQDMERMTNGSEATLMAAVEGERAAIEVQKSAEQVAGAAEEQSAAANEAQSAIQEQAKSLDQAQVAAQALAKLSEQLRTGSANAAAVEQVGTTAEELSATIQELSSAASQIIAAIEQINRGSQQQAAATQQTSAALSQIEKSAVVAQSNATAANGYVKDMEAALKQSRDTVEALIAGAKRALDETQVSLTMITGLEKIGRQIDKVVDGISLVAVQTSMLAVSGAVEAARAGDAGRGFAVVSNDIRSLAREASESADQVKDTVRSIIDQIIFVRRDLEQIIATAAAEVDKNRLIVAILEKIDGDMLSVSQANHVILQGVGAIIAAAAEAATGAQQIAAAAEEASVSSRQAAAASNEQARGAEDLAAAIEEIALLAAELHRFNG